MPLSQGTSGEGLRLEMALPGAARIGHNSVPKREAFVTRAASAASKHGSSASPHPPDSSGANRGFPKGFTLRTTRPPALPQIPKGIRPLLHPTSPLCEVIQRASPFEGPSLLLKSLI